MLEELKKLEKLQKFDSLIFSKEDEMESLPENNDFLEGRISEIENKIKELSNAIAIQEEEKRKRSDILSKGEDKLRSITGKQSAIRNKEEYNALLREIDNIKRFNKELEEEIAEINREIEVKFAELQLIETESNNKIAEYKAKMEENGSRFNLLESEIEKIYIERNKLSQEIKQVILRKYERILENSPVGKAIAQAENYICKGCNMTLPPQLYNNVLKSEKIEMCPNCQVILVPSENISSSSAPKLIETDKGGGDEGEQE